MDQNKTTIFKKTVKAVGDPFGVTLTKKLCGPYAFYLEASLYGNHDTRPTGLYVYGKCEEKIIYSSWSKKENATDRSEINYGQNLSISLEAEGLNGATLALELYSAKAPVQLIPAMTTPKPIHTVKEKCINGELKVNMPTGSCYMAVLSGIQELENFYIKVLDLTGKYIKNSSGSDKIISFAIKNKWLIPVIETPTNTTVARVGAVEADPTEKIEEVEVEKVQGILKAYFAKEEFSLETDEVDGQYQYKFKNAYPSIDKDVIAPIIKKRVDALVKGDKKYAKLDDIKNALGRSYGVGNDVSFNLCKLGAKFIKINSAPLEEEVYVVAETFLLDGKEVSIKIKEKEALLYDADTDVTVLEAKEGGSDITVLKAVAENGIAKVKIKLRPKADEDLKTWKEKLAGIKDGTHTYTFGGDNTTEKPEEKKKTAGIIANKIKATLTEQKKFAKVDVIEKALEKALYKKDEQITFDVYKTATEYLWLAAECQGDDKKYEGEYLKKDGEYFVIGKVKEIIFPLLVKPENDVLNKWGKTRNWTAKQGANMTTFNSDRDHKTRKHAARDLYTNDLETVVAIADGVVLEVRAFYASTDQVTVRHTLKDGRDFIIRYGELDPNSITVKKDDKVTQKQELGKTGKLLTYIKKTGQYIPLMKMGSTTVFMLHFEHFDGSVGFDINTNSLSNKTSPYNRRSDLIDSLTILQEGYNNSFGENATIVDTITNEFTKHDARLALMKIYDLYGKEMAQTIESIYRWEGKHFKSKQYKICGSPGMEVSGNKPAPNYGWDGSLYIEHPEYTPIGLWESMENPGKSGDGGNAQDTVNKKKYIKFPSVEAGMMYIVNFIERHDGNVGRCRANAFKFFVISDKNTTLAEQMAGEVCH